MSDCLLINTPWLDLPAVRVEPIKDWDTKLCSKYLDNFVQRQAAYVCYGLGVVLFLAGWIESKAKLKQRKGSWTPIMGEKNFVF